MRWNKYKGKIYLHKTRSAKNWKFLWTITVYCGRFDNVTCHCFTFSFQRLNIDVKVYNQDTQAWIWDASLTRYVWIGRARNGLPCCVLFFVFFGRLEQSFPEDIIKFNGGTKLATCTVPSLPLAKALGWDNIPIRIIKDDIDFIAGPLSNLFYYILTVDISVINNGTRTEWSPIRSVIIRVINKIGRPRSGSPIC